MANNWKSKGRKNLAIALVMAVLIPLVATGAPLAQEPQRVPLDPDDVNAPSEIAEAATEWIAHFTQCPANDISCEEPQCMGFYDEMDAAGWVGSDSFHWGNCSAWAEDFKSSSAGGKENQWIDDVDIALFCDHGTSTYDTFWNKTLSALHFGCKDPDGDCNVSPGEAYLSYGDNDLEWLAFKACSVLSDGGPAPYYNRGYWAATMDNLHLLLGFKNSSYCDDDFGEKWAEYMLGWKLLWFWLRPPYTVTQSWFETVDDTQPGGVCARVLAEESYFFNDYLWGKGTVYPDYQDGDYTYLDHCSCTPPPVAVENVAQIQSLPRFKVLPRQVDKAYVMDRVALAFPQLAGSEVYSNTEYFFMVNSPSVEAAAVTTYTLQVDRTTGSYKFRNASMLWTTPPEAPVLPSSEQAQAIARGFFAANAQRLPGALYRNGEVLFAVEEQVGALQAAPMSAAIDDAQLESMPVDVALSYGRVLNVTVGTRRGTQMVPLSVVGPGARTKMYMGDGGEILGVQGGSRDLDAPGDLVEIMSADDAWALFLEKPSLALAPIPWVYDVVTRTGETLGYYEQEYTEDQQELIPAWIFTADFGGGGEVLAEGVLVYMPAADPFLPPTASIDEPAPGSAFGPADLVVLKGSAQSGQPPYSFDWYSSRDGYLGSGATLPTTLSGGLEKGALVPHTISLQVTDANGQNGTAAEDLFVRTGIYLPMVLKGE
jgi:hypothetical protein